MTNHPHVTEKVKPIVDAAVDLIQLYNCNLDKLLEEVAKSSRVRRVLIIQLVVIAIGIPTLCLKNYDCVRYAMEVCGMNVRLRQAITNKIASWALKGGVMLSGYYTWLAIDLPFMILSER